MRIREKVNITETINIVGGGSDYKNATCVVVWGGGFRTKTVMIETISK